MEGKRKVFEYEFPAGVPIRVTVSGNVPVEWDGNMATLVMTDDQVYEFLSKVYRVAGMKVTDRSVDGKKDLHVEMGCSAE